MLRCCWLVPLDLIRIAYQVRDHQILDAPPWADSDLFDAGAVAQESATITPLVQQLLAEKFHLRVRRETRDLPAYVLTVAQEGLRMHRSPLPACTNFKWVRDAEPDPKHCGAAQSGPNLRLNHTLDAVGTDSNTLATFLANELDRVVIDRTGLSGLFDFHLEWHRPSGSATPQDEFTNPSLPTAAREQLGLELRLTEASVDAMVVEHLEKPR